VIDAFLVVEEKIGGALVMKAVMGKFGRQNWAVRGVCMGTYRFDKNG
jgi:hypothetical protein